MRSRSDAQIELGASRCARALFARGVAAGDAIGLYLADGDARTATIRACDALGATAVSVSPRHDADVLRIALDRANAVALVHERGSAARVAAAREELPKLRVVLSVDDESGVDLTHAGSEDFESALAGTAQMSTRGPAPS